jgi:DNA-binding CsgD family transcriptional regulator
MLPKPMTHDLTTDLTRLSRCILELHEQAHGADYHEQQTTVMERIGSVVPFDAGMLAGGSIQDGIPVGHDVRLFSQPWEFIESWQKIRHQDPAAVEAMRHPGTTLNVDTEGPFLDGRDLARQHCREWKVAHLLCTALVSSGEGLYWVMAIHREARERPFSESERRFVEALVPHVFASTRQARIGQLRRSAHVSAAHGHSAAIVSREGVVLEAEPGLVDLLRTEWPTWSGPFLPPDLWRTLARSPTGPVRPGRLVVQGDETEGVHLVHVRRSVPADELTAREAEVAEAFSLGETHRTIAARLAISPSTVRRHLANIYDKLGISSKAELDRMLALGR